MSYFLWRVYEGEDCVGEVAMQDAMADESVVDMLNEYGHRKVDGDAVIEEHCGDLIVSVNDNVVYRLVKEV